MADWLKEQDPGFPVITLDEDKGSAKIVSVQARASGYRCTLIFAGKSYNLRTSLMGLYNVYNASMIFLALMLCGVTSEKAAELITTVEAPPGRMQRIPAPGSRQIFIDYAHTADALEQALKALQAVNPVRIICVFGCGGDRDREKRPQMGRVATLNADFAILTNDNPRSEDPMGIFTEIKSGISGSNFVVIPDREKAIRAGLQILKEHEILLIAGKGHEDTQTIGSKVLKFNDAEVVQKLLPEIDWV
jgi:UDP-N-acetylmuramoyl-L-alanyl-D-glutamate--2,6-diaminopimelate ligase